MTLAGLLGILLGTFALCWVAGVFILMAVSEMTTGYGYGTNRRENDPRLRWKLHDSMESHGVVVGGPSPLYWQLAVYGLILVIGPLAVIAGLFMLADQVRL